MNEQEWVMNEQERAMNEVQCAERFYTSKPIEILMVEDNPGDVRLTREALKQNGAMSCNAISPLF
jgi:hypothetical protein